MTTPTTPALSPATVIPADGFVPHGRQEGTKEAWWHDPATDRWYLERPSQHARPPRVDPGHVILEWTLARGRVFRGPGDDEGTPTSMTDTVVYCAARGPMTEREAVAWRRDRVLATWAAEVPHRPAPPTIYRMADHEPMTAAEVVRRAALVDLEPAMAADTLSWVSRRSPYQRPEATDPALVALLERFAPLVAASRRKVDAPPCARCKRPAVTAEAIGLRLLCDRHAAEPILPAVEPPANWLAERAAMPPALVPEDPLEGRRRLAMSELEATRLPMPRDTARAITQRERRGRW